MKMMSNVSNNFISSTDNAELLWYLIFLNGQFVVSKKVSDATEHKIRTSLVSNVDCLTRDRRV